VPTSVPKPREASRRSPSLTTLSRSKTLRVLWPLNFMATRSGLPARTMLRIAVRRKSCGILPGHPAAVLADAGLGKSFQGDALSACAMDIGLNTIVNAASGDANTAQDYVVSGRLRLDVTELTRVRPQLSCVGG
jgi:hypothetical protein